LLKKEGSKMTERSLKENQKSSLPLILKTKLRGQRPKERAKLESEGNEN
jgi:hypothetical protein